MHSNGGNYWLKRTAFERMERKTIVFTGAEGLGKSLTKAAVTLTSDATAPSNNDTVTIDGHVYTAKTTLTGAADEVLIGASAAAFLDNLKSAVNGTAGEGTTYGTGTVAHTTVDATTNTDTTQLFVAKTAGAAGNALAVSEASTHLTFGVGVTTFSGGSDGRITLFTVTGSVDIALATRCTESLVGAATLEVGIDGNTAAITAQLADATTLDEGESYVDNSPATVEAAPGFKNVPNGQDIILSIGSADITDGTLEFDILWKPRSIDGNLVAA